jgi:flagellar basal body-associated protein FliL
MADKKKVLITLLVAIIVVMAAILVYIFVIRPTINGYVISGQNQGYEFAIVSIMQQALTCQPVPLTFENQTINIIATGCLQ